MNSIPTQPPPANSLLAAAIDRGKVDDVSAFVAISLLRHRHRERPEIQAKLAELATRRLERRRG